MSTACSWPSRNRLTIWSRNVASLGFDLKRPGRPGKIALDHVRIERNEIEETGEYDLEGIFVRLRLRH